MGLQCVGALSPVKWLSYSWHRLFVSFSGSKHSCGTLRDRVTQTQCFSSHRLWRARKQTACWVQTGLGCYSLGLCPVRTEECCQSCTRVGMFLCVAVIYFGTTFQVWLTQALITCEVFSCSNNSRAAEMATMTKEKYNLCMYFELNQLIEYLISWSQ